MFLSQGTHAAKPQVLAAKHPRTPPSRGTPAEPGTTAARKEPERPAQGQGQAGRRNWARKQAKVAAKRCETGQLDAEAAAWAPCPGPRGESDGHCTHSRHPQDGRLGASKVLLASLTLPADSYTARVCLVEGRLRNPRHSSASPLFPQTSAPLPSISSL